MVADHTEDRRVVRSKWSVFARDKDIRKLERRCFPERISPKHGVASYSTTPNHMIACAALGTQARGMRRHVIPRCGRAFLHSRDTADTTLQLNPEAMPAATFTILRRRRDCGLRNCVIVRQSVSPYTFRKANATITMMDLACNNLGDKGAIALAECLKATLVTCFSGARDTL